MCDNPVSVGSCRLVEEEDLLVRELRLEQLLLLLLLLLMLLLLGLALEEHEGVLVEQLHGGDATSTELDDLLALGLALLEEDTTLVEHHLLLQGHVLAGDGGLHGDGRRDKHAVGVDDTATLCLLLRLPRGTLLEVVGHKALLLLCTKAAVLHQHTVLLLRYNRLAARELLIEACCLDAQLVRTRQTDAYRLVCVGRVDERPLVPAQRAHQNGERRAQEVVEVGVPVQHLEQLTLVVVTLLQQLCQVPLQALLRLCMAQCRQLVGRTPVTSLMLLQHNACLIELREGPQLTLLDLPLRVVEEREAVKCVLNCTMRRERCTQPHALKRVGIL